MADRVLTWYIPKGLWKNVKGTNVSTEYVLDEDYIPVRVLVRQKEAQADNPTIVDINDDGTSIFGDLKPAVGQGLLASEFDVFSTSLTFMEKDSVITLDVDQVSSTTPGSHLVVHLELDRA